MWYDLFHMNSLLCLLILVMASHMFPEQHWVEAGPLLCHCTGINCAANHTCRASRFCYVEMQPIEHSNLDVDFQYFQVTHKGCMIEGLELPCRLPLSQSLTKCCSDQSFCNGANEFIMKRVVNPATAHKSKTQISSAKTTRNANDASRNRFNQDMNKRPPTQYPVKHSLTLNEHHRTNKDENKENMKKKKKDKEKLEDKQNLKSKTAMFARVKFAATTAPHVQHNLNRLKYIRDKTLIVIKAISLSSSSSSSSSSSTTSVLPSSHLFKSTDDAKVDADDIEDDGNVLHFMLLGSFLIVGCCILLATVVFCVYKIRAKNKPCIQSRRLQPADLHHRIRAKSRIHSQSLPNTTPANQHSSQIMFLSASNHQSICHL